MVFMAVNSVIWLFSYYSIFTINRKLVVIEKKKELLDTILEARRYEKNFLLKNNRSDLETAIAYVEKTEEKQIIIEKNFSEFLEDVVSVKNRTRAIQNYKNNLSRLYHLYTAVEEKGGTREEAEQKADVQKTVARLGHEITTDIEKIEKQERDRVFHLLNRSRNYLVASLTSLFILSILTAYFLVRNVNRPLRAIEKSIGKIVSGDFNKIPRIHTGDEFESLADSLNHMIEELDKRKDQLVQAEKMSSLGILTSGVAHELNNPLNNISTAVQIVREELPDPDIAFKKELLLGAEAQIDRARDIIRALLEFSRESEFQVEPILFKTLVQSTMHLISGEIPSDIEITIHVPENLTGKMDPRRIQQVLLNLIINGVHAMPGGGRISISAYRDEQDGCFVFTVEDTGQGIAGQDLAKIFDPFFTTRKGGKGSGLGLSISHGIVQQHGGNIHVESEPGQGTIFKVSLPDDKDTVPE